MRQLFRTIDGLSSDESFQAFQNSLVAKFYDELGRGYSQGDNEVALVHRLVEAANGESYGPLRLYGSMLHGTRSYVEFNYLDKPVTKELGDMALIMVVTAGHQRLLQRVTIIQNKKSSGKSWSIDQEQLFLLKNFPPFAGNKGIFQGVRDLAFRNTSGCLGSYGLLASPGEMIFIAAPLVSEMQRGKKSVSLSDISVLSQVNSVASADGGWGGWSWPGAIGMDPEEWYFVVREVLHRFGPEWPMFNVLPQAAKGFLGNIRFGRDLYDLTRDFTQISIGEVCFAGQRLVNANVDGFANLLLRAAGFGEIFEGGFDNVFGDMRFEGQMGVIVAHLNVEREG